jgi:hypothetical protein
MVNIILLYKVNFTKDLFWKEGIYKLDKEKHFSFVIITFENTVKPLYNGHPWDLKKVAV